MATADGDWTVGHPVADGPPASMFRTRVPSCHPGGYGRTYGTAATCPELDDATVSERGLITQRLERGALASVDEDALGRELTTGETSTLTIGEGTRIVALERTPSRRPRTRLRTSVVEPADLAVGATVVAWSRAVDDGPFEAGRIVVLASTDEGDAGMSATADEPMAVGSPAAASSEPAG